MKSRAPVMPDFFPRDGKAQLTLNAALERLSRLGISVSQITLGLAGRGCPTSWVVDQNPSPGQFVSEYTDITLGLAVCDSRPRRLSMRESNDWLAKRLRNKDALP